MVFPPGTMICAMSWHARHPPHTNTGETAKRHLNYIKEVVLVTRNSIKYLNPIGNRHFRPSTARPPPKQKRPPSSRKPAASIKFAIRALTFVSNLRLSNLRLSTEYEGTRVSLFFLSVFYPIRVDKNLFVVMPRYVLRFTFHVSRITHRRCVGHASRMFLTLQ